MKLSVAVDEYVNRRRSEGAQFTSANNILGKLCRFCGDIELRDLTFEKVKSFLNVPARAVTRSSKLSAIRCFVTYHSVRGAMPEMAFDKAPKRHRFRLPIIYTEGDIRAILNAVGSCRWQRDEIDSGTLRTALLLFYATGITLEEVITMNRSSVDIPNGCIRMAGTFAMPSRMLPIGEDLQKILAAYLDSPSMKSSEDPLLFRHKSGTAIMKGHLWQRFRRLQKTAHIKTKNGILGSLRDLRYTFAVHRLTHWIKQGENLNELLPALSTYMGYASLTKAEQFLSYTPERFREDLSKLSPEQPKRHWREEPELMAFLSSL